MKKDIKKKNKIDKVSSVWGSKENTSQRYGKGFHWVESPVVMENINMQSSGKADVSFLEYFIRKYLKGRNYERALSLGSGMGKLERWVQKDRIFKRINAIDAAEVAVKQAEELAKKENIEGIRYKVGDLNNIKLRRNHYDIVFANSSLHHVENLELLFKEIRKTLKKNGLFYVNEFVGPSQFQYTDKQVKIINEVLELLPREYRKRVTDSKVLKPLFVPPTREHMNENDPSEAIRSSEIVELLTQNFTVVEHKNYGGTLLHMLLQDIVGNFNPRNAKDKTVLKLLIYLENTLIKEGVLPSDFTFMILVNNKGVYDNWKKFFS